jgi:hypothetical protein
MLYLKVMQDCIWGKARNAVMVVHKVLSCNTVCCIGIFYVLYNELCHAHSHTTPPHWTDVLELHLAHRTSPATNKQGTYCTLYSHTLYCVLAAIVCRYLCVVCARVLVSFLRTYLIVNL